MLMHVNTAGGDDEAFGVAHGSRHATDQLGMHAVHDLGIAGLANGDDLAVLDADVTFDDAYHRVDDQRVTDQHVQGTVCAVVTWHQTHAVAQGLAPAVQALIARYRMVELDFRQQGGIAQAHGITSGWAIHRRVLFACHRCHESGSLEELRAGTLECDGLAGRIVQVAVGQTAETVNVASAAKLHQLHFAQFARFKAHGSASRNIQVHAERDLAREIQGFVDFEKVVVTADLNRSVTGVDGPEGGGWPPRVELDIGVRRDDFTGCGQLCHKQETGAYRLVHRNQLGAVGEGAFHLQYWQ